MSEERRNPSEEVRAKLDELGIEYVTPEDDTIIFYDVDGNRYTYNVNPESGWAQLYGYNLTPEQAIAATVGNSTDLSKRLREVHGLHAFAELFGFDWTGESDWDWHDVACAMADAVDAATVGNVGSVTTEEVLRQLVAQLGDAAGFHFASKYVDCIVDEYAGKFATAGNRSCASCPEMDNPDSYISLLQSALKWHNGYMSMPTNPHATCVVLQGERPPEEVLFVREDGEVSHYLPEETCVNEWDKFGKFKCSKCGLQVDSMSNNTTMPTSIKHCQKCGSLVTE